MTYPFRYPSSGEYRHGPAGYASYDRYRDWLRDEYHFRCAYCLTRERWLLQGAGQQRGAFHIDHVVPVTADASLERTYENLVYSCSSCNISKSNKRITHPRETLLDCAVTVEETGHLSTTSIEAKRIIDQLALNSDDMIEFRMLLIGLSLLAPQSRKYPQFKQLFAYPEELPNLSLLRPPSNSRPEGVKECYFAQRRADQLPSSY